MEESEGKGREGKERRGECVARHARKPQGRSRSLAVGHRLLATGALVICVTLNLLLKYLDETFAKTPKNT